MDNNTKVSTPTANNDTSTNQHQSVADYMPDLLQRILSGARPPAISTGFPQLDSALGGGLYPGLYTIGAISSLGKTTLMCQIADQIAVGGRDVLIFSLEMGEDEIIAKSISRLSAVYKNLEGKNPGNVNVPRTVTVRELLNNPGIKGEKALLDHLFGAYRRAGNHIYIYEGKGDISVKDVYNIVEEHIQRMNRNPVVVIDYIQILAPYDAKFSTDKQHIDKTILELKRLSRDFDLTVIGISSLNRMSYNDKVSMSAYKESGAIEYSSDVLIGLQLLGVGEPGFDVEQAKQQDPRKIELVVLKNRNGLIGPMSPMYFYPRWNYFTEIPVENMNLSTLTSTPLCTLFLNNQLQLTIQNWQKQ